MIGSGKALRSPFRTSRSLFGGWPHALGLVASPLPPNRSVGCDHGRTAIANATNLG